MSVITTMNLVSGSLNGMTLAKNHQHFISSEMRFFLEVIPLRLPTQNEGYTVETTRNECHNDNESRFG